MSLLLNIYNARRGRLGSETDSSETDSERSDSQEIGQDNVFSLLPPDADEVGKPAHSNRKMHQIGPTDLERLAIDGDGRLYWDGKPVEVHRRLLMSRGQAIFALVIGAFIVFGAVLQGTSAARDWACRFGWATSICDAPTMRRSAFDIPA